jgi:hypothetical protein
MWQGRLLDETSFLRQYTSGNVPKPRLSVRLEPGLSRSVEFEMYIDTMANNTLQRMGGTVAMPRLLV